MAFHQGCDDDTLLGFPVCDSPSDFLEMKAKKQTLIRSRRSSAKYALLDGIDRLHSTSQRALNGASRRWKHFKYNVRDVLSYRDDAALSTANQTPLILAL